MLNFFRSKNLTELVEAKKKIKIKGVVFTIKKIDILNYLDGSDVLQQAYQLYKMENKTAEQVKISEKRLRDYYSQVLCAGVVEPKLSIKESGDGMFVEKLFVDWDLTNTLYEEIMSFTYGKKKLMRNP